jgi:Na+-driven multidrug efflux pump
MFSAKRLKNYLKFGVGGGLMVLFEVWGFEATTILAGILGGAASLNAHTIAFNSLLVSFTIPLSLSIGGTIAL